MNGLAVSMCVVCAQCCTAAYSSCHGAAYIVQRQTTEWHFEEVSPMLKQLWGKHFVFLSLTLKTVAVFAKNSCEKVYYKEIWFHHIYKGWVQQSRMQITFYLNTSGTISFKLNISFHRKVDFYCFSRTTYYMKVMIKYICTKWNEILIFLFPWFAYVFKKTNTVSVYWWCLQEKVKWLKGLPWAHQQSVFFIIVKDGPPSPPPQLILGPPLQKAKIMTLNGYPPTAKKSQSNENF